MTAFGPDPPAMLLDNFPHNDEADAGPLKSFVGLYSLEQPEEFVGKLHVEPNAVVFHIINIFVLLRFAAGLYYRSLFSPREFNGVRQQIK